MHDEMFVKYRTRCVNNYTYIDANVWKTARLTAIIDIRVGSEKWAASSGVGPLR